MSKIANPQDGKRRPFGLVIGFTAVLFAGSYMFSRVTTMPVSVAQTTAADEDLIKAVKQDKKGDFAGAGKSLNRYFEAIGALVPAREVAKIKYFRSSVGAPDYFDSLICTRLASVWPAGAPVSVFIGDFTVFGKDADTVIHSECRRALTDWQNAVGPNLQFKYVTDPDVAGIRILPETDSAFMPIPSALADTSWTELAKQKEDAILPLRQTATIRILDPKFGVVPEHQKINKVRSAILHELGHALGINGHSANSADTMFAIENAAASFDLEYTLSERDRATIRKLYDPSAQAGAVKRIEDLAAQGNRYACQTLGVMYYTGEGKPINDKAARKWIEKAAAQNLGEGYALLAEMSFSGRATAKDYEKAFALYRQAADLSCPDGLVNMGFMYVNGLGVKKDFDKARQSYEAASKQGVATATYNLGVSYENGRRGALNDNDKDYDKALAYYQRAAAQGSMLALSAMSSMYYTGHGVKRDYRKGLELAERAADRSADGKVKLGDFYLYGLGVKQDVAAALKCYEKGAREGSTAAMLRLGAMYVWGKGVTRNIEKTKQYYKQAADLGSDDGKTSPLNIDLDDGIGNMMRANYQQAAKALDRFLATSLKSYVPEMERNFFYAAAYDNIAWRHAGNSEKAKSIAKLILKERVSPVWPRAVVSYLVGEMSEKDLLATAGDDMEKLTESKYFIGANQALNKQTDEAKRNLKWVIDEGRKDFFEYMFAENELTQMKHKS